VAFASEQIEAESKEKVLSALSTAAWNLRKKLGESLSSMQKYDVGIEQATTPSLEALKAYSMANDERSKGKQREALAFYKRAVDLDPNFAMAWARIGVGYANQQQPEAAKEYVQKAWDLRDRVSERERLYISEKYYTYITGELDKTIETLQTWARLYPNDFIPHNNLSLNYKLIGRYEDAMKEGQEAVRLSPNNTTARDNLTASFVALGRVDEAEQMARESEKINPDIYGAHLPKYFFAFRRRDQAGMDREVEWSKGRPEEAEFNSIAAFTAMYFGKWKEAEQLNRRSVELFRAQGRKENSAQGLVALAGNLVYLEKCSDAKDNAKAALSAFRGQQTMAGAAQVFAACGDESQAQSLLDELLKLYPKNTIVNAIIAPMVRAEMEAKRGNYDRALELLESCRAYDFGQLTALSNPFGRAHLYLKLRRGNEAAAEFKSIVDHPFIDPSSLAHPLSLLGLGRALAMNGDTAGARKSYQDFFALWKDADSDLPPLVQAKKEYEQLK
jgi:tetratricopeptide (TPR) repeat protein